MKGIFSCILILLTSCVFGQQKLSKQIDSLVHVARYEEALTLINSSLTKGASTQQQLINKKAEILIIQGKLKEAEELLLSNKQTTDELANATTLSNLGFLYLNKGRHDLALETLEKALAKFQSSGNQNTPEGATCFSRLGLTYSSTARYNQAEENQEMALQIREQLFGKDSEEVAASLNDLGLVYAELDPDKALGYYERALATYQKMHGNDHPKIAIANTNMGFAYRKLDLLGDAITHFEEAQVIWQKLYPNGHPSQAVVQSYLGQTYKRMNNVKASVGYFENSLAIYKKSYGEKHYDIANIYNELGIIRLGEKKYNEALTLFHNAVLANSPSFKDENPVHNPSVKEVYNGNVMVYSQRYKAQAFEERYYGSSLKLEDLKFALTSLYSCDSLIDEIRKHSTDESDKIALGAVAAEVYEDGVRVAQAISEMTVQSRQYREIAFYFAEKSKSAVLMESVADTKAKSFAGIPEELLEEERNLKSSITFLSQQLSQKPSAEEEKYLREALFGVNQEYTAFIKKLEKDFPKYYNLKFNSSSPSVAQIQQSLQPGVAVVSFFINDKDQRVYQFIITRKKFSLVSLRFTKDFEREVKGFTNGIYYSDFITYNTTAASLKKLLTPKVAASVKKLIIIPAGRLSTLPFEALPLNNNATGFEDTRFLAEKYAVSYEFSASLMLQKEKETILSAPSIFLCAPVNFPEKDNLNDLPATEKEVNTIASYFTSSSIAKFEDANETKIKTGVLSDYNYLHFATHGIVNETEPELSRIFLNTGTQDDGNLYSGEIYNLNLRAELAVLSACQTGLGKFSKGEGVIGLSRALIYAGAKNIVVSFWSVADESTSDLMTKFYQTLSTNKDSSFAEALQKAKLDLIKSKQYAAPYYWAPFVLIGN